MGLDIEIASIFEGRMPGGKATIYTVPAGKMLAVKSFTITNIAGADRFVNVYVKRSGGTSRRITPKDFQFQNGYLAQLSEDAGCLSAGDVIEGDCSITAGGTADANGVDVIITGVLNTPTA